MSLEHRIKLARSAAGLTMKEVAQELGTTPQAYSQYENGSRFPKKDRLEKLAEIFSVDLCYAPKHASFFLTKDRDPESVFNIYQIEDASGEIGRLGFYNDTKTGEKRRLYELLKDFRDDRDKARLDIAYNKLSPEGKREAVKRVEELSFIPEYQAKTTTELLFDLFSETIPQLSNLVSKSDERDPEDQ